MPAAALVWAAAILFGPAAALQARRGLVALRVLLCILAI